MAAFQHRKLLAQGQVLKQQTFLRAKEANEGCERGPEETKQGEHLYQNAGGDEGCYVIDSKAGRSFGEQQQEAASSSAPMYRDYDIFEVLPNGSKVRVVTLPGLRLALAKLERLVKATGNECFVADALTRQIMAQRNLPAKEQRSKRIFQVAYDEELGNQRAQVMRSRGYHVIFVVGNEKAKILLSVLERYALFILCPNADEKTRSEMVEWLKAKYPSVKILALNSPAQELRGVDYNVTLNGSEAWLPIVTQHLAGAAAAAPTVGISGRASIPLPCSA